MTSPGSERLFPPPRRAEMGAIHRPAAELRTVIEPGFPTQGYRLRIGPEGATAAASDSEGLHYARTTYRQLRNADGTVVDAEIEDHPDFPIRGLMLDISRDKVPSLETLMTLVDLMAEWKLNHFQLYMEHTFAYSGHADVWRLASPLTAAEVQQLVAHAADRHVTMVANQNCLGHMERWLAHSRYRPLAILPHVSEDDTGRIRFPTTLDPTQPGSLRLVRELLSELLDDFPAPAVNVGLDEPWELPPERTADYAAYISALRATPELEGREMLMWGDIVSQHPELVDSLPSGVTVLEWGYDADHPFDQHCGTLARTGHPFWVCPGTSSWNTLVGRWSNARDNCLSAAAAGREHGAAGYLVTDWGDHGHLQPLPVSLPGLAVAAAGSWNGLGAEGVDWGAVIGQVILDQTGPLGPDRAGGLLRLGDAHLAVKPQTPNTASVLLHYIWPQLRVGQRSTEGMDEAQLEAYLHELEEGLAPFSAGSTGLVAEEMQLAVDIARLLVRDARGRLGGNGSLASVPEAVRASLAAEADELEQRHRALWTRRNRPGGLEDSAARLGHLARCYRQGRGRDFAPSWAREH
jgi:hexosaminidase